MIGADEFDAMWTDLVELMKVGVRRGKIIVVRREHDHGGRRTRPERPRTYVYRRAGRTVPGVRHAECAQRCYEGAQPVLVPGLTRSLEPP